MHEIDALNWDINPLRHTVHVSMSILKVTIKTFTELNLYTESGLAKVAVGVRLEGPNVHGSQRTYRYTSFNRGEPEVPNFNHDVYFNIDWSVEDEVFVKFRIVEEGPIAVHTTPYDSRSASPVLEIVPERVKRTIIAYGRIQCPTKDVQDLFRRVQLFEVTSDEICGELAVGLHWIESAEREQNLPAVNMLSVQGEMRNSMSSMETPANESAIVLTLEGLKETNSTAAEAVSNQAMKEIVEGRPAATETGTEAEGNNEKDGNLPTSNVPSVNLLHIPQPSREVRPPSVNSSRSSLAEETDFEDEGKLTADMVASGSGSPIQTFNEDDVVGVLSIEVVAALNLLRPKRFLRNPKHEANPFCTISFGKRSFRTKVKTNTSAPIWKERLAFTLKATEMSYQLVFSVYDYENLGYNFCISTAQLRINHFIQNPEQVLRVAVPLNPTKQIDDNAREASLLLKVNFMPFERVRKNFWTKLLKAFDLNNNGRISKVELETMLESLGSTLSDATIERFFTAVNSAEGGEIEIDEAVKFLEDLSVLTHRSPDGSGENIVLLRSCPFCLKKWKEKMDDLDVITHLGICSASESNSNSLSESFVMGGFLTEEYASRKWFSRWLGFMSFGNYKIGRNNANIFVQDRRTGKLIEEKIPTYIRLGIRLLHQNVVTYRTSADFSYIRNILQSMTIQQGKKYDHPSSVANIPGFIKYHKLPVHEIRDPLSSFKSFNEFFYRRIKLVEFRPLSHPDDPWVTVSPADCRLHVFSSISEATRLWIKGVNFSVADLLGDQELGQYFDGGSLVISRLAPQDYHRFHSPVEGVVAANYYIPGTYFTVNPMAVRQKVDVYTENARTVTVIDSQQFGKVAFVSIGAMMVGSIKITTEVGAQLKRLDEVGYFAFGGSTIVLLYAKSAGVQFDSDLLANSQQQLETLIKVGDSMGRKS